MLNRNWDMTWSDFAQACKDKDLIIWGGGKRCSRILPMLKRKYVPKVIIDSDKNRWGECIEGILIASPNYLNTVSKKNTVILICGARINEIAEMIENAGFDCVFSEYYMEHLELHNLTQKDVSYTQSNIDELLSILSDDLSKKIVLEILDKRKRGRFDYESIWYDEEEYFRKDFFVFDNEEVFVDAGAYNGDTIFEFVSRFDGFKKILAFEPDSSNYDKLVNSLSMQIFGDKIKCFKAGLSNVSGQRTFWSGSDVGSYIGEVGRDNYVKTTIKCMKLDDVESAKEASFIKMDIEGSEYEALQGARNIIVRNKPKLAICLYHKPEHLWEIPLLIKEMVPEYKMYIRHFGYYYTDTILYVTKD